MPKKIEPQHKSTRMSDCSVAALRFAHGPSFRRKKTTARVVGVLSCPFQPMIKYQRIWMIVHK